MMSFFLRLYNSLYLFPHTGLLYDNPLNCICTLGHVNLLKMYLKQGQFLGQINQKNFLGQTPFFNACRYGHVDIVKILIEVNEVDINLARVDGKTPLLIAIDCGHLDVVKTLLSSRCVDYQLFKKANFSMV